jgi:hypothetical protein
MANCVRTNLPGLTIGLCVMAFGGALLLDRLDVLEIEAALHYWPAALILLGGSMIAQAIRGPADGAGSRPGFPIGALVWMVLIGIFLTNIFDRNTARAARDADGTVTLFALMSGDRRTANGEFRAGEMTAIMGGTQLDLRQARMAPGEEAVIDVFALMGGAVVYVPREWTVDVQTKALMGGVTDQRFRTAEEEEAENAGRRPRGARGRRAAARAAESAAAGTSAGDAVAGGAAPESVTPAPDEPPSAPATPMAIEREDGAPPAGPAPRIVLRGVTVMGGLVIKS